MSVTFHARQEPAGWRTGCAFDQTVYPTFAAAEAATLAHRTTWDDGPCDQARAWQGPAEDQDVEAFYAAYDAKVVELDEHPDSCAMSLLITPTYDDPSPEINMSQANAAAVLEALGLVHINADADRDALTGEPYTCAPHWSGELPAEDLRGRLAVACALRSDDPGIPSFTETSPGGATFVDCGRSTGYLDAKFAELLELVEWADTHQTTICWG